MTATSTAKETAENTTKQTKDKATSGVSGLLDQLPVDRLKDELQGFGSAIGHKGMSLAEGGIESLTGKLNDYANGNVTAKTGMNIAKGDNPVKAAAGALGSKAKDAVSKMLPGGGGGSGGKVKVTNILETIDVPVNRQVAYEQWTQFEDFPTFTKKVENVKQEEDEVVTWKAQIFLSHRSWKATIVEQVPNERIVWKSEGEKGKVDGSVTFHELAPDLTRILLTLEYHPQGFFEKTGNLWRAQGRRVRADLRHFRRHVAAHVITQQDEVEGWKGEIRDGEVVDPEAAEKSGNEDEESQETDDQEQGSGEAEQDSDQKDQDSDQDSGQDSGQDSDNGSGAKSKKATKKSSGKSSAQKSARKSSSSGSSSKKSG